MNRKEKRFLVLVVALCVWLGISNPASADGGECITDLDGCGSVDIVDVLLLYESWGSCRGCNADFNDDGVVDGEDLGYQLGHWGACSKNLNFPMSAQIDLVAVEITDPETEVGLSGPD